MAVWSKPLLRRRRKRPEHVGLLRAYVKAVADGCLAMLALEAVARWPAQAGWPTTPTPTGQSHSYYFSIYSFACPTLCFYHVCHVRDNLIIQPHPRPAIHHCPPSPHRRPSTITVSQAADRPQARILSHSEECASCR